MLLLIGYHHHVCGVVVLTVAVQVDENLKNYDIIKQLFSIIAF